MGSGRILLGVLALSAACATAAPAAPCLDRGAFHPWSPSRPAVESPSAPGLGDGLIAFYQRHLRSETLPEQGCRFGPSCSAYGREALARWSILGLLWLVDRFVVREHPFADDYYLPVCAYEANGDRSLHDPVP